jgi:hypothetical protein
MQMLSLWWMAQSIKIEAGRRFHMFAQARPDPLPSQTFSHKKFKTIVVSNHFTTLIPTSHNADQTHKKDAKCERVRLT